MDPDFHGVTEGVLVPRDSPLPALRPSLSERDALARAWLDAVANDSGHTASAYRTDIAGFFEWVDAAGLDVFSLLPAVLDQYRKHLQTGEHTGRYVNQRKLKPATVARKLTAVSSFYKYGQRQGTGLVRWNPVEHIRRPKPPRTSTTLGLDQVELSALLDVARRRGPREYALVMLLAGTGLRISEVCNADTGDLVRESGRWYLRVVRKGGEEGLVGVADPCARAVRRYMRGRRGPLFQGNDGERMTRRQAAHWIQAMANDALGKPGQPGHKRITPHSLRHTIATTLLDQGISISDVQALLGHTTIATTARYDRARRERSNPAVAAMAAILEDGTPDVSPSE